jgi:hypothetical protein
MNIPAPRALDDKLFAAMPLIGAEAAAASAVSFLSSALVSAYLADWLGFTIAPFAILPIAAAAAAATFFQLRRGATSDRPAFITVAAIVCFTLASLLWLARPDVLPTGSGPDLAHHLALVDYIERHWRLVHDVRLSEYLGEMIDYTPGSHLLAALFGRWLGRGGLHTVYPVVAGTVAVKAGLVFLIAYRLLPRDVPRIPFALMPLLLLLIPRTYSIGSFTEQSYLAQVTSELFAVAMWWALTVWDERPARAAMALFALFGVAAFLTWPVWTGPLLLTLAAAALRHRQLPFTMRVQHVAIAAVPIGAVAVMHAVHHMGGLRMAGTGGFAIWPDARIVGWWFAALSAAGLLVAATERRSRAVTLLVAAIALQAMALVAAARSSGAAAPYLALKMFYLAIYPLSVAAALGVAAVWRIAVRVPRLGSPGVAWALVAALAIAVGRPLVAAPRPRPVVTQPVLLAAEWARDRMAPACIDYLVTDGYTAYWLHLAVFGQPRASGRAMDDDTFEPKKALFRWILPGGLPYAITDDLEALPRDISSNVDVLARFGPAAVVKRRGAADCPER